MKKFFKYFMAVALGASALWACNKEVDEPQPSAGDTIKVRVNLGLDTKAQFADELGITWEAGDEIRFWGNTGSATATLAAGDITGGNRAVFDMEIPNVANESPKGVFQYHWSTRNTAEWDFGDVDNKVSPNATLAGGVLTVTQAEAGVMNKAFLFMQTTPGPDWGTTIPQASGTTAEVSLQMQITGSIFRVLPYTETYNDETVQSVTLYTNASQTLGGTVAYNYADGSYRDAQTINWLSYNKNVVNLATGFSLTGVTSREASKGIYFAVARTDSDAHKLNGYNILVTTDKAKYTFSTTKATAVHDNAVKNIFLKLENANEREDLTVVKGTYNFWGSIADGGTYNYNANAHTNEGLGYWVVSVLNTGESARTTIEASAHPEYYVAQFTCIDDATGLAADWLTVGYRPNDTWWAANIQANTSATARSATVTATYPDNNNGYIVETGFKTRTIHINQKGYATILPVLSNLSASTIPAAGGSVTADIDLQIDGVAATAAEFDEYIGEVTLTAENGSVVRSGHQLTITAGPNPTTSARTVTATATANGGSDSVSATQEASATAATITFSYGFSGWQGGNLAFTRSYDSEAHAAPDWMIVLTDLTISTTNSTPVEADMPELLKYGFGLTQTEYDALAEFVQFSYDIAAGETKIWFRGVTANTGDKRVFDKWFKTADLSADYVHVTISQSKYYAPGANMWPDLTVNTDDSYYGPSWVVTPFPTITKGANNSSYSFNIPTECNARWQCQFTLLTDLPQLDAAKTYTFSCTINCSNANTAHVQLMTAGIGYPVDDDVAVAAGTDYNFSKDFTGFALVNAKLIVDFGFAPANTDVMITNISIAEKP
ncbi:MAG: hypothetical protein J5769_04140 [Bacteroidales bacterium]|nr:hypothetical protein [Bacteroidales bacterium]